MFFLANKEVLKASLLVDEKAYKKQRLSNIINAFSILFIMLGSWSVYQFKMIPDGEATPLYFWILVCCSLISVALLIDGHFETSFYKKLLNEQANENLFSEEELRKINASFVSPSEVSDRDQP